MTLLRVSFGWTQTSEYAYIVKSDTLEQAMDKIEAALRKEYYKEDADKIVKIMRHDKPARRPTWIFGARIDATYKDDQVIDVSWSE